MKPSYPEDLSVGGHTASCCSLDMWQPLQLSHIQIFKSSSQYCSELNWPELLTCQTYLTVHVA